MSFTVPAAPLPLQLQQAPICSQALACGFATDQLLPCFDSHIQLMVLNHVTK